MALFQGLFENLTVKVVGTLLACSIYPAFYTIYNLYFHPLTRYPGPKFWAATRFGYILSLWSGWLHKDVQEIHRKYGEVVRIAPDEISFAKVEAFSDIYSNTERPAFPKSKLWHGAAPGRPLSVLNALDPRVHARFRKAMDPAFTEKSVRLQEPIIQEHIDLLITQLNKLASKDPSGAVVNIVAWYSFASYDMVGDLSFGESFGSLRSSETHPWVALIFASLKAATYRVSLRYYPGLSWLIGLTIPKTVMQQQLQHWKIAVDKINRRLSQKQERPDLVSMIKRDDEGVKGLSLPEMHATASVLIVAGSETTVTVLSGITNRLIKSPDKLALLTNEVRSTFKRESDMTLSSLKDLTYLGAVIQEGLRLCDPTPVGAPRITPPGGGSVAGHWLPEGTFVNVHRLTLSRSPDLFYESEAFLPERWLGEDPLFANDQRAAVQTFGVGPRSCIGRLHAWAEMRLILARLVWRFDLKEAKTKAGALQWDQQRTFTVVERQPFEIHLQVRKDGLPDSQGA
ncbi:cytochrome P450 [Lentithecium fluviatile CBS 122367]|uniref:Cytochrome P450 n=1 Tax=Lentithecium fluviatile CBS 122367 TaxID=1168545 RepID=A0A6G1JE69_9PLEO|nr:cytochrome P450 [Lentithecium fluviatile CBS 122367]